MIYGLFALTQSNINIPSQSEYEEVISQADSVVGEIDDIGENYIRLTDVDNIYFVDANTAWKEKDTRNNDYVDLTGDLAVGDRVMLKITEMDVDYYVYEVRKEPARSVAGMVIEVKDNILTLLDWQEKIYEVNTSVSTEIVSIGGNGLTMDDLYPGSEIIVTSYADDLGEYIIKADYIEVVE